MKKIIFAICFMLLMVSSAFAGGFTFATNYEVTDTMAVIYKQTGDNAGSAGLHLGTLFDYTTDTGMKAIGIGGITIGAQGTTGGFTGMLGLTALTLFNDVIQLGVNYSPNDDEKFHFMIGISSVKFGSFVGNTVSNIIK